MELRGYVVQDYHNTTSHCTLVGEDGSSDDAQGLIDFMRGIDYFDYNGDCNITEVREHVMGDIYHSQLIEVGPPEASLNLTVSTKNLTLELQIIINHLFLKKHLEKILFTLALIVEFYMQLTLLLEKKFGDLYLLSS